MNQYSQADFRPPIAEAVQNANLKNYDEVHADSINHLEKFWDEQARKLKWFAPWTKVLDRSKAPFFSWFVDGKTNMILNCLDRHIDEGRGNKLALIYEDEAGGVRTFTFKQLALEVNKFANVLKSLGILKGDRVGVYMGRSPEQVIAMMACAKIGAVHNVVYGGLSVEALQSRLEDCGARLLVVADGGQLNGKIVRLKDIADEAVERTPSIEHCVVVKRTAQPIGWKEGRDLWWSDLMQNASDVCATEPLDAEDPFFIIYTSGSTGRPKGVVHTLGGYMVDIFTTLNSVMDMKPDDIMFCTSDAGWIVGHTIVLYGPLLNGVTTVMYEGAPGFPNAERWWSIIEKYKVTLFYTSPTGVRGLMRFGDEMPNRHDLTSLRVLSCAGEPLNPEAWRWFYEVIGGSRCPVIDSWWQTETSRPMVSAFVTKPMKPGSCALPVPGVQIDIVDDDGKGVGKNVEGALVIKQPWPGMLRTIFGDPDRYAEQYWSKYPGMYLTGDAAKFDDDGYLWVIGRVDDVIKVSGYRLGTAEVESALVSHPSVAEAAVIGLPHEVRGNAIHAFVILRAGVENTPGLGEELRNHVGKVMGPIAKPEKVSIVTQLPKTRSGKIMRRVLKAQALGQPLGDLSTLEG